MEHLLLKAATTTQEAGTFEAVISSSGVDRELDVVSPQGLVDALHKWVPLDKKVPLAWHHSTLPEDIIGYIDPSSAHVVGNEVVASGWIDQSMQRGKDAWRLCKTGVLAFSFGYLVPEGGATARKGGGRMINTLDIFEVTAVAVGPMNNDTRVLHWKALPDVADQREEAETIAERVEQERLGTEPADPPNPPAPPIAAAVAAPESASQRRRARRMERREHRQQEEERIAVVAKSIPEVKAASDVGPAARAHLAGLIKYYMGKPHPFTSCVTDNAKRFGPDGADRVCATLKDIGAGTTEWRDGGKAVPSASDQPDTPIPDELVQQLYDAAGGDLEQLLEMWFDHAQCQGEDMSAMYGPPAASPDAATQRAKAVRYDRQAQESELGTETSDAGSTTLLSITTEEMDGLAAGELKAVWSAATINNLPDSAFLYVEDGGKKDADGKTTPRSLRHFPYRDASGAVDLPHLRNALARIPQSDLAQSIKDRLAAKAQQLLDAEQKASEDFSQKGARPLTSSQTDETDRGSNARSADPLRNYAESIALEYASDGESLRKPPARKAVPTPHPQLPLEELRRRSRDEILSALTGGEE